MAANPLNCSQEELDAVFLKNKNIWSNLGVYENISRSMAVNGKGLAGVLPFLVDLIQQAPWANLGLPQLREAVVTTLQVKKCNDTDLPDRAWVNQRVERVVTLLTHVRRLLVPFRYEQCIAKCSSADKGKLEYLVSLIDQKYIEPGASESGQSASTKRQLTSHPSDVSIASDGFPAVLRSPNLKEAAQSSEVHKAAKLAEMCSGAEGDDLLLKLGLSVMKKPAAKAETMGVVLKKPAFEKRIRCDLPRALQTKGGILKMTFATGQSYIHFKDVRGASTFLLGRSAKASPKHVDEIWCIAQKLSKLRHDSGKSMKDAALKMKTW